jgi:hypothetical protein
MQSEPDVVAAAFEVANKREVATLGDVVDGVVGVVELDDAAEEEESMDSEVAALDDEGVIGVALDEVD